MENVLDRHLFMAVLYVFLDADQIAVLRFQRRRSRALFLPGI
jgi:hypothetical protein